MKFQYDIITNKFNEEFNKEWKYLLEEIGCYQDQLTSGSRLRAQNCMWGFLSTLNSVEIIDIVSSSFFSISIEMIHKASIILDDWIDNDSIRHGKSAFHMEYPAQKGVILALYMMELSMFRLKRYYNEKNITLPQNYYICIDVLLDTIYSMSKGAWEEINLTGNDFFSKEKIEKIIKLETSEILGNSLLLGYYANTQIGKINTEIQRKFKNIGEQCGFFFQVLNDLEAFVNPEKLIKNKGNLNLDILKNRKNYVIAVIYELAKPDDKLKLDNALSFDIIINMAKKYEIKDFLSKQLSIIYDNLMIQVDELMVHNISLDWCNCYKCFLNDIKKYCEERMESK